MISSTIIVLIVAIVGLYVIWKLFLSVKVPAEAQLSPSEFEAKSKERGVVIIDVRTASEFSDGKIKGAKNISYPGGGFKASVDKMDRNSTYLVYCLSGSRSAGALNRMKALGFSNVYHLNHGINNWRSFGKSLVR